MILNMIYFFSGMLVGSIIIFRVLTNEWPILRHFQDSSEKRGKRNR